MLAEGDKKRRHKAGCYASKNFLSIKEGINRIVHVYRYREIQQWLQARLG